MARLSGSARASWETRKSGEHTLCSLSAKMDWYIEAAARHLNIGAGRIVWQDIVRIDVSIKKRQFHKSKNIVASMQRAKDGNGRLHLLGLVSPS